MKSMADIVQDGKVVGQVKVVKWVGPEVFDHPECRRLTEGYQCECRDYRMPDFCANFPDRNAEMTV